MVKCGECQFMEHLQCRAEPPREVISMMYPEQMFRSDSSVNPTYYFSNLTRWPPVDPNDPTHGCYRGKLRGTVQREIL